MDAEKAPPGHGWPIGADLRSGTGVREVERSETRMPGQAFCLLLRDCKSETPNRAEWMPRQITLIVLAMKKTLPRIANPLLTLHAKDTTSLIFSRR